MGTAVAPARLHQEETAADRPEGGWTWLIDDIRSGRWCHPETGEPAPDVPNDMIVIREDLDGAEPELLAKLGMKDAIGIVADANSWDALGGRIRRNLGDRATAVILSRPHADLQTVEALKERLADYEHVVAVGSGTVNDLCKYATAKTGRRYCVFATAASMDGYTSSTASMSLDSGLKISLPAEAASGVFIDLKVSAAAPGYLAASGFGDSLCRSVAQTDWWMSHTACSPPSTTTPPIRSARMTRSRPTGARPRSAPRSWGRSATSTACWCSPASASPLPVFPIMAR